MHSSKRSDHQTAAVSPSENAINTGMTGNREQEQDLGMTSERGGTTIAAPDQEHSAHALSMAMDSVAFMVRHAHAGWP